MHVSLLFLLWLDCACVSIASQVELYYYPKYLGSQNKTLKVGDQVDDVGLYDKSIRIFGDNIALRIYQFRSLAGEHVDVTKNISDVTKLCDFYSAKVIHINDIDTPSPGTIWLFEKPHYQGLRTSLDVDSEVTKADITSGSIKVSFDMGVARYTNADFEGYPTAIEENTPFVPPSGSLRVYSIRNIPSTLKAVSVQVQGYKLGNLGSVWVFQNSTFTAQKFSYQTLVDVSRLTIPAGLAVLAYEEYMDTMHYTYWDADVQLAEKANAVRIVEVKEWQPPIIPGPVVILNFNSIASSSRNYPPLRLPLGSSSDDRKYFFKRPVRSVTVPDGLVLVVYNLENFGGTYRIWNSSSSSSMNQSISSFKVMTEVDTADWSLKPPASNSALVYAGENFTNERLVVQIGQEVPYLQLVYPYFGYGSRTIGSIVIVPGLKFVGYSMPYYMGTAIELSTSTDRIEMDIQSLRVLPSTSPIVMLTDFANRAFIHVQTETQSINVPVNLELPQLSLMLDGRIREIGIPQGWQVVGYTSPYFLGLHDIWISSSGIFSSRFALPSTRIRSMKIIPSSPAVYSFDKNESNLHAIFGYDVGPTYKYWLMGEYEMYRYLPGETEPCVAQWLTNTAFRKIRYIARYSTTRFIWYEECHFKGISHIEIPRMDDYPLLSRIKSFKILHLNASINSESDFVG